MPTVFTLIGGAWGFYRKQPVLNSVILWLLALPAAAMNILLRLIDPLPPLFEGEQLWPYQGVLEVPPPLIPLVVVVMLALVIVMTWGEACVLLVGRRLIQSRAGRTRTSFRAVRREGARFVATLFLTDILRTISTVLWAILLIIPGIVYFVRTAFFPVVIITEDLGFRTALRRSAEVVRGQSWYVFWMLLGLGLITFLPAVALSTLLERGIAMLDLTFLPAADIITSALMGIATVLFSLSTMILYGALRDRATPPVR